jgi:hypothetical protein
MEGRVDAGGVMKANKEKSKALPTVKEQKSTLVRSAGLEFGSWSLFGFWVLGFGGFLP